MQICVFEGDGIGPEVMGPTLQVLDAAVLASGAPALSYKSHPAGAGHYRDTGTALPESSIEAARTAHATLLAAMGLPEVRKSDGTEITPQIDLRIALGLYAGVRPVRTWPGTPPVLAHAHAKDIDFVLVRESTEGMFAHLGEGHVDREQATETLRITRPVSEKLFDFAFCLARRRAAAKNRKAHVTCVDKANVFRAFWFMREIFEERAKAYPDVGADAAYVDAVAMWMVQRPWSFDVMVTENMFGDILSDLGAGLIGSLGLAPSADIGDGIAVFQPCHGTAPDIAGQGVANPMAMILSGAMMLDWLSVEHDVPALADAAVRIERAVGHVLLTGAGRTADIGGSAGTKAAAEAVLTALQ